MDNLNLPTAEGIERAYKAFPVDLIYKTPLVRSSRLSKEYDADVWMKLETDQMVGSYKIRGAFWKLLSLDKGTQVVCASAGNHSQGFAASCNYLGMKGVVFMPKTAAQQKQEATKGFGNGNVEVRTIGESFAQARVEALKYADETGAIFIDPFDDVFVCEGQGTIALEILSQLNEHGLQPDFLSLPVGGGGLYAGTETYRKQKMPNAMLFAIEPDTSAAMQVSKIRNERARIPVSSFVDGVAVPQIGNIAWKILQNSDTQCRTVTENSVCKAVADFHRQEGRTVETAGALSVAGLEACRNEIKGKVGVCIVTGRNIDMKKLREVEGRSDIFTGRAKSITVTLADAPGALKHLMGLFPEDGVNITYLHHDDENSGAERAPVDIDMTTTNPALLAQLVNEIRKTHTVAEHSVPRRR